MFSRIKLPRTALNWLAKAHVSKPEAVEPIYAIAVMCYRMKRYKPSLDFSLLSLEKEIQNPVLKNNLRYLVALNYKLIGNTYRSNEFYSELISELDLKERKDLIKYTWGLIMLPLIGNRKVKVKAIENLKLITDFYAVENPTDPISHAYDYKQEKWFKKDVGPDFIKQLKFFSSFTEKEFNEQVFPKFVLRKYKKNEVIYTREKDVSVIIFGDVLLKSHTRKLTPSRCLARFGEGDIIGFNHDGGSTLNPDNW